MRPSDRHTFHDPRPLRAHWDKPRVESIHLKQDEIDGIMGAPDPETELRKLYLTKTAETARN